MAFAVIAPAAAHSAENAAAKSLAAHKSVVQPFTAKYCAGCHGAKKQEGDLNFSRLNPNMKTSGSAARWVVVVQKLSLGEMPPKGSPQPKADEIKAIVAWIKAEMKRANKHVAFREEYRNGNKVPHELLFDPKQTARFDAKPRLRRASPQIYARFIKDVGKNARGVSQPFSPSDNTTFKDMGAPKLDEPVTAVLIRNALALVEKDLPQPGSKRRRGGSKELKPLLDPKHEPTDGEIKAVVRKQFENVLKRKPTGEEADRFTKLMRKSIKDAGRITGIKYTLAAVYLMPEAIFRWEIGRGVPDARGRVRLTPRSIAFALAYALTDRRPDGWLLNAAEKGKLDTREGVAAAVRQMLADKKLEKPRIMRFFREYFDYAKAVEVFKDPKANKNHDARMLVADTDRLIEYILERDKDVLYELLTTNKSFIGHTKAEEIKKKREKRRREFEAKKRKNPEKYRNKVYKPFGKSIYEAYNLSDFPDKQPAELPANERAGVLTQPAWLVAFAKSDENDAIHRGKWVRERLLGNVVPDIPITVDAQLPNAPHQTLRKRMAVTEVTYCWKCHQLMNPVGLPFETFDHYGRFRKKETVLDREATAKNVDRKGKPRGPVFTQVAYDSTGKIDLTGDARLKSDVGNAIEMLKKLAKSERVEQVFIRHVFRYFMGRNETVGDAKTLQQAHKTYKESGGSMKALIVSLLSSESFLYRVPSPIDFGKDAVSRKQ